MSLKLMSAVISPPAIPQRSQESDRLLSQLLECVKQCQTRYGGKKELATEFDTCVAALCLALESVLLHGLRNKPLAEGQVSALKQVSEIVSSSLHLSNDNLSFWPFVSKHLTKHENERYMVLKQIWTDTGRGKAWIRSALNEKSLERYFHTLLSNKSQLNSYYEEWALLCDEEKSNLLPNMAAGLGSILFAISIDKTEFNCGNAMEKMDKLKSMAEPIIGSPIPENTCQKKKRKVPKQIISFDDEENTLSSSVPSSSSSIASDTLPPEVKSIENKERPVATGEKPKRKLSIETSGSREKFFTSLEGPLTPVQANIGELTPVSVEQAAESPDTSDNIQDNPIDISNIFTEIEKKNLEIGKLNKKVEFLTRENDNLQEQLKSYIGAVQLLKRGNSGNVLDNLEQEEVSEGQQQKPDYQTEAKIFETKLVQVAEMHAELIDFNIMLQQKLCLKDKIVERLRDELEEIRGPVKLDEDDDTRHVVNIWIPSAFLTGSGSSAHHVYQIFLRAGCDEWNIYRRYAQFYALHTDLKKLDPAVSTFDFPPKKSIGKKDAALVEDRRKRLQRYLRHILAHWPELSQCNSRFLLEQHFSFFKDQEADKKIFSPRRSPNDNHYAGL